MTSGADADGSDGATRATPGAVQAWVLAARPKTLSAAVIPVVLGSALALRSGGFSAVAALLCLAFALLIQIGTNFSNDYFDYTKGADSEDRVGPARAVAAGWIRPEVMRRAMALVFLFAFLTGCGLIHYGGWWLIAVGLASIASGLAYTGGPYPLGYHGFGDLFVILFFGLVAVTCSFYVQTGTISKDAVLVGVSAGMLINNLLVVNNMRDHDSDARAGKNTLVVRFGVRFGAYQYQVGNLVTLLLPVLLWQSGFGPIILLPLGCLPVTMLLHRRLRRCRTGFDFNHQLAATSRYILLFGVVLAGAISLS